MGTFKELLVWQEAMDLAESVYHLSYSFPKEEIYGLTSQIRRASVSVASNIAEGSGRRTKKDFLYFLSIASGSLRELETQVLLAGRIGFLKADEKNKLKVEEKLESVGRLLTLLKRSLREKG